MTKKQRKIKNKKQSEEFQTAYNKSDWFGSGRRNRPKHKVRKEKLYKKIQPNSGSNIAAHSGLNQPETVDTVPDWALNSIVKPAIVPAIEQKQTDNNTERP